MLALSFDSKDNDGNKNLSKHIRQEASARLMRIEAWTYLQMAIRKRPGMESGLNTVTSVRA
jgi:hypothetical protein